MYLKHAMWTKEGMRSVGHVPTYWQASSIKNIIYFFYRFKTIDKCPMCVWAVSKEVSMSDIGKLHDRNC